MGPSLVMRHHLGLGAFEKENEYEEAQPNVYYSAVRIQSLERLIDHLVLSFLREKEKAFWKIAQLLVRIPKEGGWRLQDRPSVPFCLHPYLCFLFPTLSPLEFSCFLFRYWPPPNISAFSVIWSSSCSHSSGALFRVEKHRHWNAVWTFSSTLKLSKMYAMNVECIHSLPRKMASRNLMEMFLDWSWFCWGCKSMVMICITTTMFRWLENAILLDSDWFKPTQIGQSECFWWSKWVGYNMEEFGKTGAQVNTLPIGGEGEATRNKVIE